MKKAVTVESVRTIESSGHLKGFVDINIAGITIMGCPVMEGKNGLFATMPRKLGRDGRWMDIIKFDNGVDMAIVLNTIVEAYKRALIGVKQS
jgi:DNA-binding cell septation regulator SpoVG